MTERSRPSRRILSIWLPRFGTDRLRAGRRGEGGRALVVSGKVNGRPTVAAVDAAAAAEGVVPGMPLPDARVLIPDLRAVETDPAGAARDLERLADWCGRYSPVVALDGSDGLLIDTAGCDHLFGGEAAMCGDVIRRIGRLGFAVRIALADTPGAAWAVARYGTEEGPAILPSGDEKRALADLPVAGLRLPQATVEGLAQLGLRRIGALIDLPRAPLAARFGAAIGRRLDQALGESFEPVSPRLPVPPWRLRTAFPEPLVRAEDAEAVARRLVALLCARLERERLGLRGLELVFYRLDGHTARAAISTARPSRAPAHLMHLLRTALAAVDLGSVPEHGAEVAVLSASGVEPLSVRQLRLGGQITGGQGAGQGNGRDEVAEEEELATLVDRLNHRLGDRRLVGSTLRESHLPERVVDRSAPHVPPLPALPPNRTSSRASHQASFRLRPRQSPWGPRPLRLLPYPEPIEAMALLPDASPAMFLWRRIRHRVRLADGPERLSPEWWLDDPDSDADAVTRDYYRVDTVDGRRFWVFRRGLYVPNDPKPAWFLHGLFA